MPENNVTVTVTADASQAKRTVDELTQTVAQDAQKIAASFQQSSGTLRSAFEAATARAGTSVEKLGGTLKSSIELATARAGDNIRGLQQSAVQTAERIGAEFKKNGDSLKTAFDAATQRAGIDFKNLEEQAQKSGTAIKTAYQAALQRAGPIEAQQAQPVARAATVQEAAVERTTAKTKELAQATRSVGEASENAGRRATSVFQTIEGIVERMLIRLVAIKLIFDAINAVARLIGESMRWEAAGAQFKALTDNSKTAAADLQRFQQAARATGIEAEEFVKMDESLQGIGENAKNAANDALLLGQYAKYSGEGFERIMRDMRAMRLESGTLEQMRELVALEGSYGRNTKEAINALEEQDAALKKQQQDLSVLNEFENRRYELERRQTDESQRHADAVEEFGNKLGLGNAVLQRMAQGLSASGAQMHIIRGGWEVATVNLGAASAAMQRMLGIGNQRIMQEEGISSTALRQLEQYGLIDSSFVLSAYHRQMEDQRRRQEWAHEDRQTQRHLALAYAQYQLTEKQRGLEARVADEIARGTNLEELRKNYSNTAAAAMERFGQAVANIARDMPALVANLAKAADAAARLADAMERVTTGKAGFQARAQEAAQISARFFPTGGAPTPARLGFGVFPEERAGAHSGFAQADVDRIIKQSLAAGAWASTARGVPAGYHPADISLEAMRGAFPIHEAAVAAQARAYPGGARALQRDTAQWLLGGGRGLPPGATPEQEQMTRLLRGGGAYGPAGAPILPQLSQQQQPGGGGGNMDAKLNQIIEKLTQILQHDQEVFGTGH